MFHRPVGLILQLLCSPIGNQGPDYDAKFCSFEKSFEKSFENFLNKTITKIFKGLFKGLFKRPKFCIVIGTLCHAQIIQCISYIATLLGNGQSVTITISEHFTVAEPIFESIDVC